MFYAQMQPNKHAPLIALAHCFHGQVQCTIDQLRRSVNLECAPLSVPLAVLSSKEDEQEADHFASMQKPPRIVHHNEMEAPPWDFGRVAGGMDEDDEPTTEGDPDASQDHDEDPEDSGDTPPDDPNTQPPSSDHNRQSVLLYHLDDIPIHTMLNWVDFHVMMREVAHHFAMDRVELLDCHDMTTQPSDIPDGIVPLIVQFARDIPVGEPSFLVMIDVVTRGQAQEAHFETAPRVRRHVIPVPAWLVRQALLIQIQLFEYCRFEHNRCLVKHEGMTWPLQEVLPRRMQHGNYLQVVVPPPQHCEIPTRDMIEASRNLDVETFWSRYYVPTPPEAPEESAESETDVSPSLIDSDEIRNEFGRPDDHDSDVVDLMQRPIAAANQSASSSDVVNTTQQITNESCVLNFNPSVIPWPHWLRAMGTFFGDGAWIENNDEGPVAYLTTWYADCSTESVSEVSRVVRVDAHINLWVQDIQHAWRDKIQRDVPVHFAWVFPKPLAAPTEQTIGHLIVYQNPNEIRAPILLNFQFRALTLDGTAHAVAVVPHGISPEDLTRRANLDRVCRGRRCTLHRGVPGKRWYEPFRSGEGIKMVIPSPGERADDELHWGLGSVVLVDLGPLVQPMSTLSMRLEDQSLFIQRLHPIWQQQGQRVEISQERMLEVHTWYIDGIYVPFNDQQRNVLLGGDFTTWEQDLRKVWHDLEDAGEDINFAIVHPTPPGSPLNAVHILLHQHLNPTQVGLIVTKYDNAVRQGAPFSTAIACANPVTKDVVLEMLGQSDDCAYPGVQCRLWLEQQEVSLLSQVNLETGRNMQLHIYRHQLPAWTSDGEETDENAFMQQNTMSSACNAFAFNANAAEFTPGRPPIATLPEHMQDRGINTHLRGINTHLRGQKVKSVPRVYRHGT